MNDRTTAERGELGREDRGSREQGESCCLWNKRRVVLIIVNREEKQYERGEKSEYKLITRLQGG